MPLFRRCLKCSTVMASLRIDIRALLDEQLDYGFMSLTCRRLERIAKIPSLCVDIRAALDEQLDD